MANKVNEVGTIIGTYISTLHSKTYNQQNIQSLTEKIAKCDIGSSILCFDCIKTLPSQTEISLNFTNNGVQYQKVIDLSYSPDNRIVFMNMHD
jgi:hypothetical protein